MSALAPWWKRVTFENPFEVERNLTLAAVVGGGVALLAGLVDARFRHVSPPMYLTLALCVLQVVLPQRNKWLMVGVAVTTLALGAILGFTARTMPFFCAAALGLTFAVEGTSWWRRAVLFAGPALGVAWCLALLEVFSAKYLGPVRAVWWGAFAGSGVLVTLAASLGTVTLALDPLELRLRVMDPKVRETWQRFHRVARRFSPEAHRRLLDLASTVVARWLEARLEQRDVKESMGSTQFEESKSAIARLEERLGEVSDPELRAHLEQSMRVHRDTLEQLNGLTRRAERAEARALAEQTWLDTAVLTLELTPKKEESVLDATSRLAALATRHLHASLAT